MAEIIHLLANTYAIGLIVYGISSFFNGSTSNKIKTVLTKYYEPVLQKIRSQIIQLGWAPQVDLAHLVLFLLIWLCKSVLVSFFLMPI